MTEPMVAIVTGAVLVPLKKSRKQTDCTQNRGIGKAICQVLASTNEEPLVLYAASRRGQDLGLTCKSSKTQLRYYPKLDISDQSSIESFAKAIKQDHAHVHVLINNAGVNLDQEYSPANVKTTLETNYQGTLTEAADSGTESRFGWKSQAYGVTKAATNAMTAVLARENPGLTINACCPGWVDTDMGNIVGRPPKTPGK
ncbi:MAG: hypothetical protein LQ352_002684 [Teloschistes flavicans]|nr:MAG: hypothetical protein LQ352_002684 [Teloschistes flavicans]